jgi:hypothetical protein
MNIHQRLEEEIRYLDRHVLDSISGHYDEYHADLRKLLEDVLVEINRTPLGSTKWR